MRKKVLAVMFIVLGFVISSNAYALRVTARSVSSGTYENGTFTPGSGGFTARYDISESQGTVVLEKIVSNEREGRIEDGAEYEITNIVVSEGISALLVSRDKKGQKIITAVREADLGAFEILVIGEDFYEYSRAANGKFYLEYGEVY